MYNVWIVDDEPFILEGLASIIDWSELQLVIAGQAENGLDALEQIDRKQMPVDILITDISMPEMDGLELLRVLKERNPELKSIVLSGYNEFDYVREGMRVGIENYLLKPINIEELKQTLIATVEKLNRSRIQTLNQDQIMLLKDNILYRWMTDRISNEQWKLRSEFLRLRLGEPYVVAVILKTESDDQMQPKGIPHSVREHAAAYMERIGIPFLCFQDIDDNTVLILGSEDHSEQTKRRFVQHLTRLCDELEDRTGHRPFTAVGSLEPDFGLAPSSYKNALLTLDYALLYPHERLLSYDNVTSNAERKNTALSDLDKYARLLLAHDEEAVIGQIDDDFEALSRIEGITPSELRNAAVEMIIQMKKLLKDYKQDQPFSHSYHDIMNRVFQSTSMAQLKSHLHLIANEVAQALSGRQDKSPVIRQIIEFVHSSYREDFSLKTLGQTYRIHPVYLGQLFHKEMNQTFSDYVNRFRVEKATELLKRTSLKTHDVAKAAGYWDTAHFYKQFKKYVGVSPTQYRKLL